MVFDSTCAGRLVAPGLSTAWRAGGALYGGLRRLDAWRGVGTWAEALAWLTTVEESRPIGEIQFWGHGTWGCARIAGEPLDRTALVPGHPHYDRLHALRQRQADDGSALWWFRTCSTLGRATGHDFVRAWTDFFDASVAGHTHVIGFWQSGLHRLSPGGVPSWSVDEGVDPAQDEHALPSRPRAPHTITCLHGAVPRGW